VTHALGWLPEDIPKDARVTPVVSAALPTHFEWTQKDGQNWMTSVKNQGGCGSCVAFAAVGALEGQLKIQANSPSWSIDLSEQHLFSCGGGTCSEGWYISSALNYLQQYGTPDEACSPYQGQSGSGSCSNSCPDWQSRASKISSWSWVANNTSAVEAALMNGPLVAGFTVYADFYSGYTGGVYHWDHVSQAVGGHAIVIVGYDSNEQYWIVKNSWGSNWGENGYFKIGFGEAGIEDYVASVRASPSASTYTVTFYTDPSSGTLTADGAMKTNGQAATYPQGQRVHITAGPPSGYSFANWEVSGVTVDSQLAQDTYMTVSDNGWLKAYFTQSPKAFGSTASGVVDGTTGSVYFIFPDWDSSHVKPSDVGYASVTDWTALGFVYGSLTSMPQVTALDTDAAYVDPSTGAPRLSGKTIVLFGGPLVNSLVHYYEKNRIAPLWWSLEGDWSSGTLYYRTRSGEVAASMPIQMVAGGSKDMILVEVFHDSFGNTVLIFSGFGWKGTFAAGLFFKSYMYQRISQYDHAWYLFEWQDSNSDGFVGVNEINPTEISHGD
jgi:hypothetical protein